MRRGRVLLVALGVVVVVWVVTLVLVGRHQDASATVPTWEVARDLPAGTRVDASLLHEVDRSANEVDGLLVSATSPSGMIFVHAMRANDPVRQDDVTDERAMVRVPIGFKKAPGLVPGELIDIYVTARPGSAGIAAGPTATAGIQLLARGVLVADAGGGSLAIEVPAALEQSWVAISASDIPLIAVLSSGVGVPSGNEHVYTVDDAVGLLSALAAQASGAGPAPRGATDPTATPAPTPSPQSSGG